MGSLLSAFISGNDFFDVTFGGLLLLGVLAFGSLRYSNSDLL